MGNQPVNYNPIVLERTQPLGFYHDAMNNSTSMTTPTPQDQLKARLETAGIAHKEISVYGRQVVVKAFSLGAAQKWHQLLNHICAKVRMVKAVERASKNDGAMLCPVVTVWLVGGAVK